MEQTDERALFTWTHRTATADRTATAERWAQGITAIGSPFSSSCWKKSRANTSGHLYAPACEHTASTPRMTRS